MNNFSLFLWYSNCKEEWKNLFCYIMASLNNHDLSTVIIHHCLEYKNVVPVYSLSFHHLFPNFHAASLPDPIGFWPWTTSKHWPCYKINDSAFEYWQHTVANLWPEGLYSKVTGSNSNVIKYAAQTVKIMVTTKQNLARNDTLLGAILNQTQVRSDTFQRAISK